jgi:exonuclease VII large subunit
MVMVDGRLGFYKDEKSLTVGLELVGDSLTLRGNKAGRFDRWRSHFEAVREQTVALPMPKRSARLAIVTGKASAAIADIRARIGRPNGREFSIETFFAPLDKPDAIAAQIRRAADVTKAKAVVIARGGGHVGELNVFNHPEVISAIGYAREKVAVLTAIGHAHDEIWASRLATKDFAVPASVGDWLRR